MKLDRLRKRLHESDAEEKARRAEEAKEHAQAIRQARRGPLPLIPLPPYNGRKPGGIADRAYIAATAGQWVRRGKHEH